MKEVCTFLFRLPEDSYRFLLTMPSDDAEKDDTLLLCGIYTIKTHRSILKQNFIYRMDPALIIIH